MLKGKLTKGKIIKRVILILLGLLVAFVAVVFTVNKVKLSQELKMLDEKGYYNLVSVGDYSLNVISYGNENGKHKFVPMAGAGDFDLSVDLRTVTDKFSDDNQIIFVDRAGYGLSDDTTVTQTVDRVVDDYRAALKNAGYEGPYILLPHSISGIYASYWVMKYPEEIEGVVFFDGTVLEDNDQWEDEISPFRQKMNYYLCRLGMYRLVAYKNIFPLTEDHPQELNEISYALHVHHGTSNAVGSEVAVIGQNIKTTWDLLEPNDVPKNYISAGAGAQSEEEILNHMRWANEQRKRVGQPEQEVSSDVAKMALEKFEETREKNIKPYLEKMGNCELTLLGGDHFIFEQRPDDCVRIISEFLDKLDKIEKAEK